MRNHMGAVKENKQKRPSIIIYMSDPRPLSYDKFVAMMVEAGFSKPDNEIGQAVYQKFLACLEVPIRNGIKVAILEADNKGRTSLEVDSLESIQKQIRVFPPPPPPSGGGGRENIK